MILSAVVVMMGCVTIVGEFILVGARTMNNPDTKPVQGLGEATVTKEYLDSFFDSSSPVFQNLSREQQGNLAAYRGATEYGALLKAAKSLLADRDALTQRVKVLEEALKWCGEHAYAGGKRFRDIEPVKSALTPPV